MTATLRTLATRNALESPLKAFVNSAVVPTIPYINIAESPYGAVDDGVTDCSPIIQSAIAALNAKGGGTLWFPWKNTGTYKVTSVLAQTLFTFTNLNGVRLLGDGVTISDGTVYAGAQDASLVDFVNCKNVSIGGINFVAPAQGSYATPHGLAHLNFRQGCSNIDINATITGGYAGVRPWKANGDPDSYKSIGFRVNLKTTNVQRPLTAEYSGDLSYYQLNATNSGRAFIIFGVRGVKIDLRNSDTTMSGAAEIDALGGKGCEDIWVWMQDRDAIKASSAINFLILQFEDQAAAYHRNIHLFFDVLADAVNVPGDLLAIVKVDNVGSADSVGRGHVIDGLYVSGIMEPWSSRAAVGMVGAFASPDSVRGVRFDAIRDTATTGNVISFAAGNALLDTIEVSNCHLPNGTLNITRSTGSVACRNVLASNHLLDAGVGGQIASTAGVITPTARRQHVSGTNAITGITAASFLDGEKWEVIPDGAFTWTTATNIALAGTAVVGRMLTFTYDATAAKFYPSYT